MKIEKCSPIVGIFMGIIAFVIIYGVKVLNPFYTDWLLGSGDLTQHYLGWEFFRKCEWKFPIGMTDKLAYPIETSVIFTDSIPIFAVFFKIFRCILPDRFQYFGMWGIMCFALQGYFAAKIFNRLGMKWYNVILGDILLIFSPIMIYRMYMHTSLAAQWLILLSTYLLLGHDEDYKNTRRMAISWGLIGFIIAGVHLYFLPICFLFAVGYTVLSVAKEKNFLKSSIPMISFMVGMLFNTWILGGFSTSATTGGGGLTAFSFNLNSFFNPMGYSNFLNDLDSISGAQQEGFAYLGLGIALIVVICVILRIMKACLYRKTNTTVLKLVFIMISLLSIILAVSPVVTFGNSILIEIQLPSFVEKIWSVFRSTGRLVWPAWYIMVIYAIYSIDKIFVKKHVSVLILALGVIIQLADFSNIILQKHDRFSKSIEYEITDDDFWNQLTEYRDFTQICISFTGASISYYIRPAEIALLYNLNTNGFYFARDIDKVTEQYQYLEKGNMPVAENIYLFLPEQVELMEEYKHVLKYYYLEDYVVGITWLDEAGNVNTFSYQ